MNGQINKTETVQIPGYLENVADCEYVFKPATRQERRRATGFNSGWQDLYSAIQEKPVSFYHANGDKFSVEEYSAIRSYLLDYFVRESADIAEIVEALGVLGFRPEYVETKTIKPNNDGYGRGRDGETCVDRKIVLG